MLNPNAAFEDELYFQYLRDPNSVSPAWREYFNSARHPTLSDEGSGQGATKSSEPQASPQTQAQAIPVISSDSYKLADGEVLEAMPNIAQKIAANMEQSLSVPTATSIRSIPVKALDENRRVINTYLSKHRRNKVSFTHILLWAIVKGLIKYPRLNDGYALAGGVAKRIKRRDVNIGLAVDLIKKDGSRLLMVPNLKGAQKIHFSEFISRFDDIVNRARGSKLSLDELSGTSVTLTNPGMIGTTASVPRLMKHQGLIIASGAIDYPVEFQSVRPEVLTTLAISKCVTMTSTYDHRVIQGAESAEFLAYIHKLLIGESRFYDQIFASLGIPFEPVRWSVDISIRKYGLDNTRTRVEKGAHVMQMVNAYRVRGHLLASINPLGNDSYYYPELDPAYYGLTIWDLDREFPASSAWENSSYPLRDILLRMRETYCGSIGIEYMHIQDPTKKDWVKKKFEAQTIHLDFDKQDKLDILEKLIEAEQFESFLHKKFIGHKRFSLEGAESLIVMLDRLFDDAADNNCRNIIVGMAHRGRLNVVVNNTGKALIKCFNEFDGDIDTNYHYGAGDVKYHLGQGGNHISHKKKNKVHVFLAPNPSHLEIIDPVVLGMARALKEDSDDLEYENILPVVIHGDAAFAGQGIIQETLNMSGLKGYGNGGTIHIIINNQIGFTTTAESARSTTYASDASKMSQCPILHVNGNDPEAIVEAARFAFDYRQKYQSDVIIDMICYRKYGHNEGDEPSYTQPLLYKKIRKMIPVREIYQSQLIENNIISEQEAQALQDSFMAKLNEAFDGRKVKKPISTVIPESKIGHTFNSYKTTVTRDGLMSIANAITSYPEGFNANPKVISGMKQRTKMIATDTIDWATGEALAFGGILLDNFSIRLSGEDSRRGTFSQRHAVLTDFINELDYLPLNHISEGQSRIQIYDSPLSELAVLGFDYGYSVNAKNTLTLWEAQFGDFANMAQAIIDQFISCSEVKWRQTCNLVMLLPHGHDGQGPEHSSARIERYLQLCADENLIIGNFTTPAQYFHALRRQMILKFPTPMILMTPKSMLRDPLAISSVEDFTAGGFQHVIDDGEVEDATKISRVLLCTGKVYYDLLRMKRKTSTSHVAILRVEQVYPLHKERIAELFAKYKNAKQYLWVQEEPKNQGIWNYILPELLEISHRKKIHYCGRDASASTATGSSKIHALEQENIAVSALQGKY